MIPPRRSVLLGAAAVSAAIVTVVFAVVPPIARTAQTFCRLRSTEVRLAGAGVPTTLPTQLSWPAAGEVALPEPVTASTQAPPVHAAGSSRLASTLSVTFTLMLSW